MKRLKNYLLNMKPDNITYKEMYEGEMVLPGINPEYHNSAMYWDEDIGYEITKSNKFLLDCPTITIHIPVEYLHIKVYNEISSDYVLRAMKPYIDELNAINENRKRMDYENGKYYIYSPNGKVLIKNASYFKHIPQKYYIYVSGTTINVPEGLSEVTTPPKLCASIMIQVQLPRKNHKKSIKMLTKDLPEMIRRFIHDFDEVSLCKALKLAQLQEKIRDWLSHSDYCAFIANGSILPRLKGSDFPLPDAMPFLSTKEDEIEISGIKGMGMKRGVTVITGGGYSGKSTLLDAISDGIYNHIEGDGRELVITDASAMKISAEDGRSVKNVNISPFIRWLPSGDITHFSTDHASGSTSQAANIIEAIHFSSKLFLIDEDKSATNFMIRDKVMKELIEHEPIIPFTDRVRELKEQADVSTILVIGGSGEYLSVADQIYMMKDYMISDVTMQSREICKKHGIQSEEMSGAVFKQVRKLNREGFTPYPEGSKTELMRVSDMGFIFIGDERIDIRMLHNIASIPQLTAIGYILRKIENENTKDSIDVEQCVDSMLEVMREKGLESVYSAFFTDCGRWLELPRKNELIAVINRMRNISFN